jgi:hypothetical protein
MPRPFGQLWGDYRRRKLSSPYRQAQHLDEEMAMAYLGVWGEQLNGLRD